MPFTLFKPFTPLNPYTLFDNLQTSVVNTRYTINPPAKECDCGLNPPYGGNAQPRPCKCQRHCRLASTRLQ